MSLPCAYHGSSSRRQLRILQRYAMLRTKTSQEGFNTLGTPSLRCWSNVIALLIMRPPVSCLPLLRGNGRWTHRGTSGGTYRGVSAWSRRGATVSSFAPLDILETVLQVSQVHTMNIVYVESGSCGPCKWRNLDQLVSRVSIPSASESIVIPRQVTLCPSCRGRTPS